MSSVKVSKVQHFNINLASILCTSELTKDFQLVHSKHSLQSRWLAEATIIDKRNLLESTL